MRRCISRAGGCLLGVCAVAVVLVGGVGCRVQGPAVSTVEVHPPGTRGQRGHPRIGLTELERLAGRDPLGFLKMCRDHYVDTVSDYRCRFHVTEPSGRGPATEQVMEVRFREDPYGVDMRWVKNAGPARRVTYVTGRWREGGRERALIFPSGVLALLVPGGVKRDIHAPDVRGASRRPIDLFGFKNTLDFHIKYCEMAQGDPAYRLAYLGRGEVDGRATFVFERRLPLSTEAATFPDRVQIINIDCGWLVPTGCFAYADDEREQLLGRYVATDVEFNVGLTDEDF